MFPVSISIPGYETEINYPNICPRSPEYQSAFCDRHSHVVKQKGIPTELRTFLNYCRNKKKVTGFVLLSKSKTKKCHYCQLTINSKYLFDNVVDGFSDRISSVLYKAYRPLHIDRFR